MYFRSKILKFTVIPTFVNTMNILLITLFREFKKQNKTILFFYKNFNKYIQFLF